MLKIPRAFSYEIPMIRFFEEQAIDRLIKEIFLGKIKAKVDLRSFGNASMNSHQILRLDDSSVKVTPLFLAVAMDMPDTVKALVQCGADCNIRNVKTSNGLDSSSDIDLDNPLTYSIRKGFYNCFDAMVHDSDQYFRTEYEQTPLILAASMDRDKMVKKLITRIPIDINASDSAGATALVYAVGLSNIKATQLLLENGADPKWYSSSRKNLWHILVDSPNPLSMFDYLTPHIKDLIDVQDELGLSPLFTAVLKGDIPAIRALKISGANMERTTRNLAGSILKKYSLEYGKEIGLKEFANTVQRQDLDKDCVISALGTRKD